MIFYVYKMLVLSCELAASFSTFAVVILSDINVYVIFQDMKYQLQENIFQHFLHYSFLWNIHWEISLIYLHQVIYWIILLHFPTVKMFYIPILKIWQFFIFILIFHAFMISFFILIKGMIYSSSNTFFYH